MDGWRYTGRLKQMCFLKSFLLRTNRKDGRSSRSDVFFPFLQTWSLVLHFRMRRTQIQTLIIQLNMVSLEKMCVFFCKEKCTDINFRMIWSMVSFSSWLVNQPPPIMYTPPPRNKGLIAGLVKGNQWVFINP